MAGLAPRSLGPVLGRPLGEGGGLTLARSAGLLNDFEREAGSERRQSRLKLAGRLLGSDVQ